MKKQQNASVSSLGEIRKILEFYKNATKEALLSNRNDFYRVDRRDASGYFGIMPKWKQKIGEYLFQIRNLKQKVVHIDICGRACGRSLGADKSYCFSLLTSDFSKRLLPNSKILIDGDLFNPVDFSGFLKIIKKGRVAPAFVSFMPMAGLQSYGFSNGRDKVFPNYEKITYHVLAKRLKSIVQVLRPGGYVLLERPFQCVGLGDFLLGIPQEKSEFALLVKAFARKIKCSVEIHSDIGGPYFLLRKWLK
ncbi:MAG: hypothetical protein AAB681_01485 [Patescibacteria group bacterium]